MVDDAAVRRTLTELWRESTGTAPCDDLTFFDAGGDSLAARRLLAAVEARLRCKVRLRDFVAAATFPWLYEAVIDGLKGQGTASGTRPVSGSDARTFPLNANQAARLARLRWAESRGETHWAAQAHIIHLAFALSPEVDGAAVRSALWQAAGECDAARLGFEIDGERQEVKGELPRFDQRRIGTDRMAAELARAAAVPMDLAAGPMLDAEILVDETGARTLSMRLEHIAFDGQGVELLLSRFGAILAGGRPMPAPSLRSVDFATWQQEWLTGAEAAECFEFWSERLFGTSPWHELAVPDAGRGQPGGTIEEHCSAAATRGLRERVGGEGSLFDFTATAFAVTAWAFFGQSDIGVLFPVANREAEFEDVPGWFSNLVLLRVGIDPASSLADAHAIVRQTSLEAQEFSRFPFHELLRRLSPEEYARPRSKPCLYLDVAASPPADSLGPAGLRPLKLADPDPQPGLGLWVSDDGDGLSLVLARSPGVAGPARAARFARSVSHVLEALAARRQIVLTDLKQEMEVGDA